MVKSSGNCQIPPNCWPVITRRVSISCSEVVYETVRQKLHIGILMLSETIWDIRIYEPFWTLRLQSDDSKLHWLLNSILCWPSSQPRWIKCQKRSHNFVLKLVLYNLSATPYFWKYHLIYTLFLGQKIYYIYNTIYYLRLFETQSSGEGLLLCSKIT